MTKSNTKQRFSGPAELANLGDSGTVFYPQRIVDETGAFQVQINQDPGVGAKGRVAVLGRLHPDATFVIIDSIDISTFIGASSATERNRVVTNLDILPEMVAGLRDATAGSWLAAAGTEVEVWVME